MESYHYFCGRFGLTPNTHKTDYHFYDFWSGLKTYCEILDLDSEDERIQAEFCEYAVTEDYWAWLDARAASNKAMRGSYGASRVVG